MENLNLISIIFTIVLAIIVFIPLLILLLLPFVKHAESKKTKGLMWFAGIVALILNAGLIISWAGDIIQNRAGDLSIIAFCGYAVIYIVAPFFYIAFFKKGKSSSIYPVIISVLLAISGISLIAVPVIYGLNNEFDTLTKALGCAGLIVPQLFNALFYIFLSRCAANYIDDSETPVE